jgi:hypothetical protein
MERQMRAPGKARHRTDPLMPKGSGLQGPFGLHAWNQALLTKLHASQIQTASFLSQLLAVEDEWGLAGWVQPLTYGGKQGANMSP